MKDSSLIVGNYIDNVQGESFRDAETNRIRVRPLPNQGISTHLVIECLKSIREAHPIGTKFYTIDCKVCKKPNGRIYLRARDQMIYLLEE